MTERMTADELRAAVWRELRNDEYEPPPETDAALVQCVADVNARLGAALVRERFAPSFEALLKDRTAELAALRARHDRLVAVVRAALRNADERGAAYVAASLGRPRADADAIIDRGDALRREVDALLAAEES